MNILGFTRETEFEKVDGPQYYRAYLPLREVHRQADGIDVALVALPSAQGLKDDDPWWERDAFVMCRIYDIRTEQAFVDLVHKKGGVVVLDSDDDLTETHKLVSGRGLEFCEVLGIVDYVTVSTQPLADAFAPHTQRPPVVLRNCVDGEWMRHVASNARRITEGLTIGFTGSPTHWGDWRLPAVPFARILRDCDVWGILHGEVPRYLTFAASDLIKLEGVPYVIYPKVLSQFDIVLCAVDTNDEFNAGKSAIKALECMALGVVPICSRFGPYLELAAQGAPVMIVHEDSPDGWYEAMHYLIEEEAQRRLLRMAGPEWVGKHRDMVNIGWRQWGKFYRSIQ